MIMLFGALSAASQSVFTERADNMTPDEALISISSGRPINGTVICGDLDLNKLGKKTLDGIDIRNCTIEGNFSMSDLHLVGDTYFNKTIFNGTAEFKGDAFECDLILDYAEFHKNVYLNDSVFAKRIECGNTIFGSDR